jgi:hypothetical protein
MSHITLFKSVGRAAPQPVCTVDTSLPNAENILTVQQSKTLGELIAGGVDPARVSFSRVSSGGKKS